MQRCMKDMAIKLGSHRRLVAIDSCERELHHLTVGDTFWFVSVTLHCLI
jgi:hypothetical protein